MVARLAWVRAGAVALGICALAGSIVALFAAKSRCGCSVAVPVLALSGVTPAALLAEQMMDGIPQSSDLRESNRLAECSQGVV